MQTKSYTINTQETGKYLITHSTVLTQTSILTVWSPRVITTGRCTVRASPTRVTLTAVSSSAGALSIHRVTMCTINTGAWDGAVSSPVTLDTRLVTELTWITTNTDAKSYDKKSHWSPDSITYSRTYFKLGYLKLPLSFSLKYSLSFTYYCLSQTADIQCIEPAIHCIIVKISLPLPANDSIFTRAMPCYVNVNKAPIRIVLPFKDQRSADSIHAKLFL